MQKFSSIYTSVGTKSFTSDFQWQKLGEFSKTVFTIRFLRLWRMFLNGVQKFSEISKKCGWLLTTSWLYFAGLTPTLIVISLHKTVSWLIKDFEFLFFSFQNLMVTSSELFYSNDTLRPRVNYHREAASHFTLKMFFKMIPDRMASNVWPAWLWTVPGFVLIQFYHARWGARELEW